MMDGSWDPIPSRVFDGLESCSEALQTLRKADHIGKIVVKVPSNLQVREGATYLITGGTGALGLALSRALLEEGVDATRHDRCVPEHHSAHSYVEKAVAKGFGPPLAKWHCAIDASLACTFSCPSVLLGVSLRQKPCV